MGSLLSFCAELTGLRPFVLPLPVMFVSESLDGQPFHAFQSSFRGHLWRLCLKSQYLFLPNPLPQTSYPHSLPFFLIFSFNCHLICCMLKNFYSVCGVSSTDNFCISPKMGDFYLFCSIQYILSLADFLNQWTLCVFLWYAKTHWSGICGCSSVFIRAWHSMGRVRVVPPTLPLPCTGVGLALTSRLCSRPVQ